LHRHSRREQRLNQQIQVQEQGWHGEAREAVQSSDEERDPGGQAQIQGRDRGRVRAAPQTPDRPRVGLAFGHMDHTGCEIAIGYGTIPAAINWTCFTARVGHSRVYDWLRGPYRLPWIGVLTATYGENDQTLPVGPPSRWRIRTSETQCGRQGWHLFFHSR
jgi:hypothetical protein